MAAHFVVTPASVEVHSGCLAQQLCCVDKRYDAWSADVFLVRLAAVGKRGEQFGKALSRETFHLLLKLQFARLQSSVARCAACHAPEGFGAKVDVVIDAVHQTASDPRYLYLAFHSPGGMSGEEFVIVGAQQVERCLVLVDFRESSHGFEEAVVRRVVVALAHLAHHDGAAALFAIEAMI